VGLRPRQNRSRAQHSGHPLSKRASQVKHLSNRNYIDNLLIFEKYKSHFSVIARAWPEAISCSVSSFTRKSGMRLLRREDHPSRNDGNKQTLFFQYSVIETQPVRDRDCLRVVIRPELVEDQSDMKRTMRSVVNKRPGVPRLRKSPLKTPKSSRRPKRLPKSRAYLLFFCSAWVLAIDPQPRVTARESYTVLVFRTQAQQNLRLCKVQRVRI
jgi:hypothetical protein